MRRKYLLLLLIPLAIALGGCPCNKKHFAPPPEPNAPSNLTATAVSYKQIHLSWQDNSDDEDYFRVLCPTMWGTQHQTIATLPANTTSYDHCNLQPMTEYEYYVCVHRGEEHTCSNTAYATTPCPVTAFLWEAWPYMDEDGNWSDTLVIVTLQIKSEASEPCRVEVIVFVYDWWDDGELIGSTKETFEVEAFGQDYYYVEVLTSGPGRLGGKVYGRAEVTDVEILY